MFATLHRCSHTIRNVEIFQNVVFAPVSISGANDKLV
jgi:hypothetical protein